MRAPSRNEVTTDLGSGKSKPVCIHPHRQGHCLEVMNGYKLINMCILWNLC